MPENLRIRSNFFIRFGLFICLVLASFLLARLANDSENTPQPMHTKAIIFPHHDLLLDQFPDFYTYFSPEDRSAVRKIIFLSPNHFEPESLVVKMRRADFELSSGSVLVDKIVLKELAEQKIIVEDDAVFENEHGVILHLPFVAENFKNAQIIPLLLTRSIPREGLDATVESLTPLFAEDDTIVIVSTDFSHDLTPQEAEQKDAETLPIVQKQDGESISQLSDDYLDCPACMYVLFELLNRQGITDIETLLHSNSQAYFPEENLNFTTSYFIFRWMKR